MTPIITATGIGKKYTLNKNQGSYIALRDVLTSFGTKAVDMFRRTKKSSTKEIFWALQDVGFTINKGEVVGIIGRNGAGKSTLLKILSQITPPTTGEITINGRVGSLLEVGTGFHPELSGRENIFLNGAILGMSKKEIAEKFDAIVAFAGVEKFLDTPVKYYSSGMYVRLAFSVAAHMEPDILIIDEVLAVGDAEFQKKCIGKMDEIAKKDGRTVLFVSHNMAAIQQLCKSAILLENGKVTMQGNVKDVVDTYIGLAESTAYTDISFEPDISKNMEITRMSIQKDLTDPSIGVMKAFTIELDLTIRKKVEGVFISLIFFDQDGRRCADFMEVDNTKDALHERAPGTSKLSITIPGFFNAGIYSVMAVIEKGQETLDKKDGVVVRITDTTPHAYPIQGRAPIMLHADWNYL